MSVEIIAVKSPKELKQFIRFPHKIYSKDPCWVPPLEFERREFFNPKKNPFYESGEAQLFLALKNSEVVGRISAQIHHGHLNHFKDAAGFFGFFESVDDSEIANKLLEAAQNWLRKKGMKRIRGPYNFTLNDEAGILVDGFSTPPYLLMTHNLPYYPALLEAEGFQKAKDLFAWHYKVGALPEQALQLAEATRAYPGLTLRSFDMKNYDKEIETVVDIFNDAWAQNWGFVPTTQSEAKHLAKSLKPILDPDMAFFAMVNGEHAGMSISLPNINEAIRDLKGKLLPLGWAKLLWRLKKKGLKTVRLCIMGIRKPYRGSALGALSVLMNVEIHRRGTMKGYQNAELSWTLEDNERINKGIEFMGGKRYKTYRIYEKEL